MKTPEPRSFANGNAPPGTPGTFDPYGGWPNPNYTSWRAQGIGVAVTGMS